MPVVLFTLHAYGTWMPDRPQGSFHHERGYQKSDAKLAAAYRTKQQWPAAHFDAKTQQVILNTLLELRSFQHLDLYGIAIDPSHVHVVAAWKDDRTPEQVQDRLKHAVSQRLNESITKRPWFTRGGHDRRVRDRDHLKRLLDHYLPSHQGMNWDHRIHENRPR